MNTILFNAPDLCEIPDHVTEYNADGYGRPTCIRFNRYGNLLAVGTRSQLVLWDVDTKSVAIACGPSQTIAGQGITSVAFPAPRTGVTVMAVHEHGVLRVWDTLAKRIMCEVKFDVPLLCAEPHPKNPSLVVIVPDQGPPALIQLGMGFYTCEYKTMKFDTAPRSDYRGALHPKTVAAIRKASRIPEPPKLAGVNFTLKNHKFPSEVIHKPSRDDGKEKEQYVVRWSHDGNIVIRGSMRTGVIDTFNVNKINVKVEHRGSCLLGNHEQIRDIVLTVSGDKLLVHTNRELRVLDTNIIIERNQVGKPYLIPNNMATTFKDRINNWKWNCAGIAREGDIVSACVTTAEHKICIWNVNDAQIMCCLEGPVESVNTITWHPRRAGFASIGKNTGTVYFWDRNVSENWSAFAPDFIELEANEEYEEKEDEFDLPDESDELAHRTAREEKEKELVVDIMGNDGMQIPGAESDDDGAPFFYIPADPTDEYNHSNKRKQSDAANSTTGDDDEGGTTNGRTNRKRIRYENGQYRSNFPVGEDRPNGYAPDGRQEQHG